MLINKSSIYIYSSTETNILCSRLVKTGKMVKINLLTVFVLLVTRETASFSCNKEECSCVDHIATCIDVFYPSFFYRPSITILYMKEVQLNGITDILRSLPNLKYITLIDMVYFNCNWIKEIPITITVNSNNCMVQPTSKFLCIIIICKLHI